MTTETVVAYRVKEEDDFVWIDPTTRRPHPGRKIVMPNEVGIEGQMHKLEPLNAAQFEALQKRPVTATSKPAPAGAPVAPADRMVRSEDVRRRRNRKKED